MTQALKSLLGGLLVGSLALATFAPAYANPPHHGGPAISHHREAPRHHPTPAPRHSPRQSHHTDQWVGPLLLGAAVVGTAALIANAQSQASAVSQSSQTRVNTPAQNTLFWCEAEKGYYPQVRACPTGWTAIPSNP